MKNIAITRRWAVTAIVSAAAALAGCASGPRDIVANVESYSSMAGVTLPATYRMELLPSQNQQQNFARIEHAAQAALQRVGLTRDSHPEQARLVVQIGATASQSRAYHPAYDDWFYGPRFGWGMGFGGPRVGFGMHWMDTPPLVQYRAVKLLLRDQQTQKIVYETSAQYDEVRLNEELIWGILFDAALSDFPHPASGTRQVRTTLTPLPDVAPTTPATTALPSGPVPTGQ